MIDEELIYSTLAKRMSDVRWEREGDPVGARRFITTSRRVRLFGDVPSASQPACFQAEHTSTEGQTTSMPYKTILEANWIIYHSMGKDKSSLPTIENNLIIKGVRIALQPTPQDQGYGDKRNTLNGLVHHCFISGRIFRDPGDLDDQAMIVVPIKLLVP
jgi:hypothetical protein